MVSKMSTSKSWKVNRHIVLSTGLYLWSSADFWLKATKTEINATLWPHAAREGLFLTFILESTLFQVYHVKL